MKVLIALILFLFIAFTLFSTENYLGVGLSSTFKEGVFRASLQLDMSVLTIGGYFGHLRSTDFEPFDLDPFIGINIKLGSRTMYLRAQIASLIRSISLQPPFVFWFDTRLSIGFRYAPFFGEIGFEGTLPIGARGEDEETNLFILPYAMIGLTF